MGRERRNWTAEEDTLLKNAVSQAHRQSQPLIWNTIAASIPGRTNKDCRKRWHYKVAARVNKGVWTASEDERLCEAVKDHGTKWARVATDVETRNGDQCSKRWNDTVNPEIDHSAWTPQEDELLLQKVEQLGRNWSTIAASHFPRRTALACKNRYSLLCRRTSGGRQYSTSSQKDLSTPGPAKRRRITASPEHASTPERTNSPDGVDADVSNEEDEEEPYNFGASNNVKGQCLDLDFSDLVDLGHTNNNCPEVSQTPSFLQGSYPYSPVSEGGSRFEFTGTSINPMRLNRAFDEQCGPRRRIHSVPSTNVGYPNMNIPDYPDMLQHSLSYMQAASSGIVSSTPTFLPNTDIDIAGKSNGTDFAMDGLPVVSRPPTTLSSDQEMRDAASTVHFRPDFSFPGSSSTPIDNQLSLLSLPLTPDSVSLGQDSRGDSTRQVTIHARCSAEQGGRLIRMVTQIAKSATVKMES